MDIAQRLSKTHAYFERLGPANQYLSLVLNGKRGISKAMERAIGEVLGDNFNVKILMLRNI
jgi:hypothetical protein